MRASFFCALVLAFTAACSGGGDPDTSSGGAGGGSGGSGSGGSAGAGGSATPGGCLDASRLEWVLPATNAHAEGREQLIGAKGGTLAFLDTTGQIQTMPTSGGTPIGTNVKVSQALLLGNRVIGLEKAGSGVDGAGWTVRTVELSNGTVGAPVQIVLPLAEQPAALLPDGANVLVVTVAGGLGSDAVVHIHRVDLTSAVKTELVSVGTTLAPFNFVRVGDTVFMEEPRDTGNLIHAASLAGGAPSVLPVAGRPSIAGATATELYALSATENASGTLDVKLQRFAGGAAPASDVALGGGAKLFIVEHPVFGPAPGGTAFYVSGAGQIHTIPTGATETKKTACFGSSLQALSLWGDASSLYATILVGSDKFGIAKLPSP